MEGRDKFNLVMISYCFHALIYVILFLEMTKRILFKSQKVEIDD